MNLILHVLPPRFRDHLALPIDEAPQLSHLNASAALLGNRFDHVELRRVHELPSLIDQAPLRPQPHGCQPPFREGFHLIELRSNLPRPAVVLPILYGRPRQKDLPPLIECLG